MAGFLSIRLVTSLFQAETTSRSLLTQAVDRWPSGSRISHYVNLQHFRPRQRAALVNCLKSFRNFIRIFRSQGFGLFVAAGNIDNGESVFVNFPATRELVVRQKKKIRLVDLVGCGHVESRARNAPRRGEEYLPESLPHHVFAISSGTLAASANFFIAAMPFQYPSGL